MFSFDKNFTLFQGEHMLCRSYPYFEGWYFKLSSKNDCIAFIPGICIQPQEKHAFLQIITNSNSYYLTYPISDFEFCHSPFYIRIGDNIFSEDELVLSACDIFQNISLFGHITYTSHQKLSSPIMGPFRFIPFMECNHAVISMKSNLYGNIFFQGKELNFSHGIGYIEKDWGSSFPSAYQWCEANEFSNPKTSLFFSSATIPFGPLSFNGFICSFFFNGEELRFSTYNMSHLETLNTKDNLQVILSNSIGSLLIEAESPNSHRLSAPKQGCMSRSIFESLDAVTRVKFYRNNFLVYSDTSNCSGLELS